MITHRTCVDVDGVAPAQVYELMSNPTDARYRRWWPGVHHRFHVVRRGRDSPVGDLVFFDESIGQRRLRLHGVVRHAQPDRRLVWQLRKGVAVPAWLELNLDQTAGGTQVEHVFRLGFPGLLGRLTDPFLRLFFTASFAEALTDHAVTEFTLLSPGAPSTR